jgi:peroxiredoxin
MMKHTLPRLAAGACALLIALGGAQAAGKIRDLEPTSEGERSLHKDWAVEPGSKVSYLDLQGKVISFAEFVALVNGKPPLVMNKLSTGDSVRFQVQKPMTMAEYQARREKEAAAFKVKPGQALPDFKLNGLDGKGYDKASLAGRYSVISFFFEACAPCIAEVPSLNKFRELHPELNLVAMTFDDQVKAQRFQDRHKLSWPVLIDSKRFNDALGIQSYPVFVVLDPQGRFLGHKVLGQMPSEEEAAGRAEHAALAAWVKDLVTKDKGG